MRFQLALNVRDLDEAVAYYAKLFGVTVNKRRPGYANFAVEQPPLKLVLFEAPTNPMLQVPDLEAIAALAKRNGVVTVLDNTFAGLHNHGRYEIDYFVHSLTKYANGHGDVMGGIVIADKKRIRAIKPLAINMGSTLDPYRPRSRGIQSART